MQRGLAIENAWSEGLGGDGRSEGVRPPGGSVQSGRARGWRRRKGESSGWGPVPSPDFSPLLAARLPRRPWRAHEVKEGEGVADPTSSRLEGRGG